MKIIVSLLASASVARSPPAPGPPANQVHLNGSANSAQELCLLLHCTEHRQRDVVHHERCSVRTRDRQVRSNFHRPGRRGLGQLPHEHRRTAQGHVRTLHRGHERSRADRVGERFEAHGLRSHRQGRLAIQAVSAR